MSNSSFEFPQHIIVLICQNLSFRQIMQMKYISRHFHLALNSQLLWEKLFQRIFRKKDRKSIDFLKEVKQAYLETDYKKHFSIMLQRYNLNPQPYLNYVGKQQIDECVMSVSFSFQRFLDFHINNKVLNQLYPNLQDKLPLFGGIKYYDRVALYFPTKLKKIEDIGFYSFCWLWWNHSPYKYRMLIDLENKLGFGNETLFFVLCQFENSKIIFVSHRTIKSFLDQRIQCLDKSVEVDGGQRIFEIVDTLHHSGSDTTTNGIRIRATAQYMPYDFQHGKHTFMYQIRISDSGVQGKYQLKSRRWIIKYNGISEVVQGLGVIGKYPVIEPGCNDFLYESCCPINGWIGSMEGGFVFKNLQTNEEFEAIIQPFPLELKPEETLLKFSNNNTVEVIVQHGV